LGRALGFSPPIDHSFRSTPPALPSLPPRSHSAVLFPLAVTAFVTLWFINFFERIFSPVYTTLLGVNVYGLGFLTSMAFIFVVGLLASSWAGAAALSVGEWIIRRLPLAKHIYSAAKQVSNALKPGDASGAGSFRECVLVRHPRKDELMIGFVTGASSLRPADGGAPIDLLVVFVPTNHLYVGDSVLVKASGKGKERTGGWVGGGRGEGSPPCKKRSYSQFPPTHPRRHPHRTQRAGRHRGRGVGGHVAAQGVDAPAAERGAGLMCFFCLI